PGTVGRLMPGTEMRIVETAGARRDLGVGEDGVLEPPRGDVSQYVAGDLWHKVNSPEMLGRCAFDPSPS
ncbi:hypothetical protein, partial [Streptomyces sp. NPDC005970]|uniref:hypothetical protein n=1 Tax=Streptomyces sp. NPDC005970 TaxID=3156723 RepID=UPI0033C6210C